VNARSFGSWPECKEEVVTTETIFTSPKAFTDMQTRLAEAVMDAADEISKRAEQSARESATTWANAFHAQTERSIDAMSVATKLRARSYSLCREAIGAGAAPSVQAK
jgi:hypothetical protein